MELLPPELQDLNTLRRLFFAVGYLPEDLPKYWSVLSAFLALKPGSSPLSQAVLKTAVDNLRFLCVNSLSTDLQLAKEIHSLHVHSGLKSTLGIVLISPRNTCNKCGGNLLVRGDRPSQMTVYTETYGTVLGTHYRKFCCNFRKGCSFTQHYGYYTDGSQSETHYDHDWSSYQYFVSTSETAFEMALLTKYDAEMLLGQISYSQKADIYNYHHGYPVQPKSCSKLDKEELPVRPSK